MAGRPLRPSLSLLRDPAIDNRERFAILTKLYNSFAAENRRNVHKKGLTFEEANRIEDGKRAAARQAFDDGEAARREYLAGEAGRLRQAHHTEQPRPGTYEHELSMMRSKR